MPSYCDFALHDPLHKPYHDHEYGFPLRDDNLLFERLVLEINQAGLSWSTILRKKDNFWRAYDGFAIAVVAAYDEAHQDRLLADPGIIRNRLKVNAAIENARRIQALQAAHGSFQAWLDAAHPRSREEWTRLFRQTFVFVGGEIVNEFLVSTGYLPGAHAPGCPVYDRYIASNPPFLRGSEPTPDT